MLNRLQLIALHLLLTILITASPLLAQPPQITGGLGYLTTSQNPNDIWGTTAALVEIVTVSVLNTRTLLNQKAHGWINVS